MQGVVVGKAFDVRFFGKILGWFENALLFEVGFDGFFHRERGTRIYSQSTT